MADATAAAAAAAVPDSPPSGVGALGRVAMDMVARGMHVCCTSSYRGADFDIVEAPLEERMMTIYNAAAEFWAELRLELLSASELFADGNSNQIWRSYWASHQRFFRHMCMSAKVPAVVKLAKEALAENKCVVIGLQSTGEARTEESFTKYGVEMEGFLRELLKLVENYPLPPKPDSFQQEKVSEIQRKSHSALDVSFKGRVREVAKVVGVNDDDSDDYSPSESDHESTESHEFHMCQICNTEEEKSLLLHCSGCCCHVHPNCLTPPWNGMITDKWACYTCKILEDKKKDQDAHLADCSKRYDSAIEKKLKILDLIRSLDLPNNPLDDIIDQLGGPGNVAEITSRPGMLIRASDGKDMVYQARSTKEMSMEMINMHEKQQFMDGKKLVAIISEAGSAGVSLHADRRATKQRRRVHITLELPRSVDHAMQEFGRTHRSSAPQYRLLFINLGGEKLFASIVAKRLLSLGALTQGDRRPGPSLSAFNYDSNCGKKALTMMYRGIMEQDSFPVVPPGCSDDETSIQEFINEAKAALISVGIFRDAFICNGKDPAKLSGWIVDSVMHDVPCFLNRLLGLPPNIQNRLFDLFTSILDIVLHNARIEGQLDSGIVDIKAKDVEMTESPKTVHSTTSTIDRGVTWESAKGKLEEREKDGADTSNDGFYESRKECMGRRRFILAFEGSEGMYKIVRPAIGEASREMPLIELKRKYMKVLSIDKVSNGWQEEYDASLEQANLFKGMEINKLRSILSRCGKDPSGTKVDLLKRASKEIELEDLKQDELWTLCKLNNICRNKDSNKELVVKLKTHKNYLVEKQQQVLDATEDFEEHRISKEDLCHPAKSWANSTNKYKEDQTVTWHLTPFDEMVEKALRREKLLFESMQSGESVIRGGTLATGQGDPD